MPNIQHAIQIAAKSESIHPLIATARGFRQWWAADIAESDGVVELGFFNRATIYRLRLVAHNPSVHADWLCDTGDEWGGTHLVFQLEDRPSGTLVRFTHAGWRFDTDYFTSCNTTWGELMYRLKWTAEGKSVGPLFLASSVAY